MEVNALTLVYAGLILLALIILFSSVKVVPQRRAYIVERLGKYRATLMAGFNILIPFIDKVRKA
jgi:regulator of protease activity HflC (stomatin/prohibitin superfamily)